MITITPIEYSLLFEQAKGRSMTISLGPYGFTVTEDTEQWVLLGLLELRRNKDSRDYLVSYYYSRPNGDTGFGSIVLNMPPIKKGDLESVVEFIRNRESLAQVVILNIVEV